MNFIVSAWIASIGYAFEVFFGKLLSKRSIQNPWAFNFLFSLFVFLLTIPLALYNHVGLPSDLESIMFVSVLLFGTSIFYSLALYNLDVSILSPLFNLRTGIVAVLSIFLLGEVFSVFQYILLLILVVSGIALTLDEKFSLKQIRQKGMLWAILCIVFLSLWTVFTKKSIQTNGYWETLLWTEFVTQILLISTIPLFIKTINKIRFKHINGLIVTAIMGTIGLLFANKAYATNVTLTSAILSLPISMLLVMLFSLISSSPLEKHTKKTWTIRFIAAITMVAAATAISNP